MKAVVFDVGNVLLRWDVKALYRQLLPDDAAIDAFLNETSLLTMNIEFDRGMAFSEGLQDLAVKFPHRADLLFAFRERWDETITGSIEGSVALLDELRDGGVPLYAITNFSAETWPIVTGPYPFLATHFHDVVVSGAVELVKPGLEIYQLFLSRNNLEASDCVFIDDTPANVAAAEEVGIAAIHFRDPVQLRQSLNQLGFLAD